MKNLSVIKRDGSREPFSSEKIGRVVRAAGLDHEQVDTLVNAVVDWIETLTGPEVTSLEIRDKVYEELKKLNSAAAGLFNWYQQTKEEG